MDSPAAQTPPPEAAISAPAAMAHAPDSRRRQILHGVLIAAAAIPLIVGCWNAGFTTYDDSAHVFANKRLAISASELLTPTDDRTYFPVTEFSYQLDRKLFAGWMPAVLHTWALGIRFMTLLYHMGAALLLWRVLRLLRIGESAAFFIALVFACHPLACETVCWASERKNALAALFGFASLWAWLRFDGRMLRMPLTCLLYMLALLSKPSALGLLPVFLFFELFNAPRGLTREGPLYFRPSIAWITIFERMLPLAVLAFESIRINVHAHGGTLQPPPGGTVFTALLTDLEILSRYLFNLAAPVNLSAAYMVDPVRNLADPRVAGYGALLLGIFAVTVWLAQRRLYALLGWLWFFGALGPNLNLIAIPHIMQDRYIYLSTPGFLLVVIESVSGILARLRSAHFDAAAQRRVLRIVCGVYVLMLLALSARRSEVWGTTFSVFHDAVQKEPQSTFAHFGLGNAYAQVWQMNEKKDPAEAEKNHKQYIDEWAIAVKCPDAMRFATYIGMALTVAEDFNKRGDVKSAEEYWLIATRPPLETFDNPTDRSTAFGYLASLRLLQHRYDEAYIMADSAVKLQYVDAAVLMRARVEIALAEKNRDEHNAIAQLHYTNAAREDLRAIPPTSRLYAESQKLAKNPLLEGIQ